MTEQNRSAMASDTQDKEAAPKDLGARLGERVRKARQMKGIPRRVLSENSGVSPRYLAQLEAGEGNISVGLLQRVAHALDQKIEWLIADDDPWDAETRRIADLYRQADREVKDSVLRFLSPEPQDPCRAGRVCFVGLRGAGKSTLGIMAARALDLPFVELTQMIEDMAGMPLHDIMAFYGHEGYRKLEAQALDRVIDTHDRLVLAVAGGIVAEPANYSTLLGRFHTIWLRASPQEHMDRVRAQGDERPMAGNPAAMDQLKSILASRETLYAQASAQLDTSGRTVEESLKDVQQVIWNHRFLD